MYRYPDKPNFRTVDALTELDSDGGWACEPKINGWRAIVDFGRKVIVSRNMRPLNVSEELQDITRLTDSQVVADAEWTGSRETELQPERIVLFGCLYVNGKWVGDVMEDDRRKMLEDFGIAFSGSKLITISDRWITDFQNHYQALKNGWKSGKLPGIEGVVLKHRQSTLIGKSTKSADNPLWIKVKFRDTAAGE